MHLLTLCFLLFGCLLVVSDSSKILAVVPTSSISHYIFAKEFLNSLTAVGHEITVVAPFENEEEANYNFFPIPELHDFIKKHLTSFINGGRRFALIQTLVNFYDLSVLSTEMVFQNENFQKLLKEKFDLVIVELLNYEALLGLGYHFDCPVVVLSSVGPSIFTNDVTGNPEPIAIVPDIMFPFTNHMNLRQRTINYLISVFREILKKTYYFPKQEEVLHKYLPNTPDLYTVLHNVSLTFVNSHESLAYDRALMPNTIPVGGVNIPKLITLPPDLQEYLDSASDGFIYVSFGTNVKQEHLTLNIEHSFMATFRKLKQKIIWKWDNEIVMEDLDNMKIGKWFPQVDILGHPNIKAFVTHGGLGSVTEALWFGVPMLGIPVFGDQHLNVHRITTLECGLSLHLEDVNEKSFSARIVELLDNPKYSKNAKKRSELFRDQPMSPQDKVRYWVEYVIKHGSAVNMRPSVFDLYWFQSLLLDVYAVLLVLLMLIIGVIYLVFSCLKKLVLLPFRKSVHPQKNTSDLKKKKTLSKVTNKKRNK